MPNEPSYQRVKAALLDDIRRGQFAAQEPFVTERAICARFGVSRTTAVRALSDLVHAGVLARRRGRGTFVVDPDASTTEAETAGTARLIGCVFFRLATQNPITMLRGIEQMCRETDYHLLLFDSKGDAETEAANIQRALKAGVDGLIISPVDGFSNLAAIKAARRAGTPLVLLDGFYPMVPTHVVSHDNVALGFGLTDYLIRQGHRHIALIYGKELLAMNVLDRFTGYRLAMREHDVPIQPDLAALRSYTELPMPERRALLESWLAAPHRPTAYLAINRQSMAAVVSDLLALGMHIPDDAAIAVMDGAGADDLLAPVAATADVPYYEMGRTALRLLIDSLAHPVAETQQVVLPISVSAPAAVGISLRAVASEPEEAASASSR